MNGGARSKVAGRHACLVGRASWLAYPVEAPARRGPLLAWRPTGPGGPPDACLPHSVLGLEQRLVVPAHCRAHFAVVIESFQCLGIENPHGHHEPAQPRRVELDGIRSLGSLVGDGLELVHDVRIGVPRVVRQ